MFYEINHHQVTRSNKNIDPLIFRISTFILVVIMEIMGYDGEFKPTDTVDGSESSQATS